MDRTNEKNLIYYLSFNDTYIILVKRHDIGVVFTSIFYAFFAFICRTDKVKRTKLNRKTINIYGHYKRQMPEQTESVLHNTYT